MSLQYVEAPIASPMASYVAAFASVLQVTVTTTGAVSTGPPLFTTCGTSTVKAGYVLLGAPLFASGAASTTLAPVSAADPESTGVTMPMPLSTTATPESPGSELPLSWLAVVDPPQPTYVATSEKVTTPAVMLPRWEIMISSESTRTIPIFARGAP